jgi:hypothetical protein
MTTPVRTYWIGSRFVAEWTLTTTTGAALTGATVAGTVNQPNGTNAAMTVSAAANIHTAHFDAAQAGQHAYRLVASVAGVDAHEGTFVVQRSLVGLAPIEVDPTTDVGMVRLLATDLDQVEPLFTDAQIEAMLDLEGGVKRAAALALETTAVSEALIGKKIRTQDLQTDGPAVAKELRERAALLRKQADTADETAAEADEGFGFDFVDFDQYAAYRTE